MLRVWLIVGVRIQRMKGRERFGLLFPAEAFVLCVIDISVEIKFYLRGRGGSVGVIVILRWTCKTTSSHKIIPLCEC